MAKKERKILAIDIGSASVKVVEMIKVGKYYQIEHAAIESMPRNVWKDGLPLEVDVAAVAISNAIRFSGSQIKNVVVSVPTAAAMTRVLPVLSNLHDDDIEATLEASIAQYLPFDASEVQIDFQKVGPTAGLADSQDVLLVAVERKFINDRDICIGNAGCSVSLVDVDLYALANLIRMIEPLDTYPTHFAVAVIDMGADRTGLHILHGDGSIYAREQAFGGDRLTEIISELEGIGFDQAESKKKTGLWQTEGMQQALQTYLSEFSDQVVNALQVYQPNNPSIEIQKIILVGGGVKIPGVSDVVATATSLPVKILDPAALVTLSPKIQNVSPSDLCSMSLACGLALRGFQ